MDACTRNRTSDLVLLRGEYTRRNFPAQLDGCCPAWGDWQFKLGGSRQRGFAPKTRGEGGATKIIFEANFLCAPRIRVKRALWMSRDDYKPGGAAGRSRNWAASRRSGWRPPPSSSHSQPAPSSKFTTNSRQVHGKFTTNRRQRPRIRRGLPQISRFRKTRFP